MENVITVIILCSINFVNYLDRFTTAAVVGRLKEAFVINDQLAGLIQTSFLIAYMAVSPLYGYLGDRYTRRYIMSAGLLLWAAIGLTSSFVPESSYMLLLITRSTIGIGQAAFSNLLPTIISDMFVGQVRTLALTLCQLAVPLGCGVGFMVAATVADFFDSWRWAYRITPPIIVIQAVFLLAYIREPVRGHAEGATNIKTTTFKADIAYILRIRTFLFTAFAFTCVSFSLGALSYWTVTLVSRASASTGGHVNAAQINFIFGLITILSGISGMAGGVLISNKLLKPHYGPKSDPIVSAASMLAAGPLIYASLCLVKDFNEFGTMLAVWTLMFVGISMLCCCWVLIIDITMAIIIPTRRATAEACNMIIGHLFGDVCSPYVIGLISDGIQKMDGDGVISIYGQFTALQQALFVTTVVVVLSGFCFLFASLYIDEDAANCKKMSQESQEQIKEEEVDKTVAIPLLPSQEHQRNK